MAIPITYNLRHLAVRRVTALLTAASLALTITLLLAAMALANGLRTTLETTGNPLNVLVLRKGSTSELSSSTTREMFQDLLYHPGMMRGLGGRPMASLEIFTVVRLPALDNPRGMSVTVRGLLEPGIALRQIRLEDGRWFSAGRREVVVGKSVARRCLGAKTGGILRFGKREWQVVGVMDGGQSAINTEVFGDLNQIASDFNRPDQLSSVLVRAQDAAALPALLAGLNDDQRLNAFAQPEKDYYARQTAGGGPLATLGIFVSTIMAIGSGFTAMNTMYAAVARRTREIGTLRVLGFSRGNILASFLVESVLLALAGGVIACLLVLPLNYFSTQVGNSLTMSEVAVNFRVSPLILAAGVGYAALLGVLGGWLPARLAANQEILSALREM
jgi:putative ABC transport system permease protein